MLKVVLHGLAMSVVVFSTSQVLGQQAPTTPTKELKAKVKLPPKAPSPNPKPPKVTAQKFGQWYYRCVEVKTSKQKTISQCEVAQVAQVKQKDKLVNILTMALAKADDKNKKISHIMTVLTPLNVLLPEGFGLSRDKSKPSVFNYRNCNQSGCWVIIPIDAKLLTGLKKANFGVGRLRLMNGQNVNIKFSLNGFSKAIEALNSSDAPKAATK